MRERIIRIPVFRTKTEEEEIELFNIDRNDMIDRTCELMNKYSNSGFKIIIENGIKNYTNEIVKISAQKKDMNGSPFVFIQMSAHKTNMGDGYVQVLEKIPVTKETKIGSDHYYMILYPMVIKGRKKYRRYWNVFLYDDPNKESQEFIKMAKEVIKQILGVRICNLKKQDFIEELKTAPVGFDITASYQTVEFHDNQFDAEFKEHIVKAELRSRKTISYKNMTSDKVEKMLNDESDETVKRKRFSIFTGKKEYKVSQDIKRDVKRAKEKYTLLIESLFNESISITEDEYDTKLYDESFVIDKMKSVITNYMS
jgi:hypothetical protein